MLPNHLVQRTQNQANSDQSSALVAWVYSYTLRAIRELYAQVDRFFADTICIHDDFYLLHRQYLADKSIRNHCMDDYFDVVYTAKTHPFTR